MRRLWSSILPPILLLSSLSVAKAAIEFPDVPSDHPNRDAIQFLAERSIAKGNDDGTFGPNEPVNRAAMLTFLYRTAGKTPAKTVRGCFDDVPSGVWFEDIVCDSAANGYVKGYGNGTFGPENGVTRSEAAKMIHTVLGKPVSPAENMPYTDIAEDDWFRSYVLSGLQHRIFPIPGMKEDMFEPNLPLTRGQVAQLILHSIQPPAREEDEVSDEVSNNEPEKTDDESLIKVLVNEDGESTAVMGDDGKGYIPSTKAHEIGFPFSGQGTFSDTAPVLYRFTLDRTHTVRVNVSSSERGNAPTCRMYRLNESGFSTEYYLGDEIEETCTMRITLPLGNYQLELSGTPEANIIFSVEPEEGDGNDGFIEARTITRSSIKTGELSIGDHADWYTFNLIRDTQMTIQVDELNNSELAAEPHQLNCVIYPMEDVEMFGFEWPSCNKLFNFPKGNYVIGVHHSKNALKVDRERTQVYRVWLR